MNSPTEKTVETPHQVDAVEQPPVLHRKIAKLPKPLRDLINTMLDDGFPAREVIAKLQASTDPPLPYPISEMNISDWKNTGYRRHLAQQERRSEEHTSELQSPDHLVCRLLLEKKN